ncbi:hypothetical protein [Streptomyces sp. NPDC050535]|uniref:hypothetical protein n=1 Tax=Streptomyces sp. NPDC050535 TaxID=3365626 RepID=UPI00379606A0
MARIKEFPQRMNSAENRKNEPKKMPDRNWSAVKTHGMRCLIKAARRFRALERS